MSTFSYGYSCLLHTNVINACWLTLRCSHNYLQANQNCGREARMFSTAFGHHPEPEIPKLSFQFPRIHKRFATEKVFTAISSELYTHTQTGGPLLVGCLQCPPSWTPRCVIIWWIVREAKCMLLIVHWGLHILYTLRIICIKFCHSSSANDQKKKSKDILICTFNTRAHKPPQFAYSENVWSSAVSRQLVSNVLNCQANL
jgi:hypothetical protein